MQPNDIFIRAARLCGTGEEFLSENELTDIRARALDAINATLFDLCEHPGIKKLTEQIEIPEKIADAAVYGTAMFLSLAFGDADKSTLFSEIYNQKRSAVKSSIGKITDVLPGMGDVL